MRALLLLLALLLPFAARAQQDTASLIADSVSVQGETRLVAEGSVEVLYRDIRLKARRITYDRTGGRLLIEGPIVMVQDGRAVLLASAAELSDDLRNGILHSARMVLDEQVQIAAASLRRVDGRYTEMRRAVASSCRVCAQNPVPLWEIRAGRVVHDQEEQQLYFENATLRVMGMPVFWLPRLRLPDPTVDRATGFLPFRYRTTSQLGTGIKTPYFITLGPSRDLLATPYVSPRTRTLELRYRQAFRSGTIEATGAVTRDDLLPDETRSYLIATGAFRLPRDFHLSFGVELASDPAYMLDYGYSDRDRLTSSVQVWRVRRDERIYFRLFRFESLRDDEIAVEDTLPQFLGEAGWTRRFPGLWGGEGHLTLDMEGHERASDDDAAGRDLFRAGAEAGWRRSWILGPGIETALDTRLNVDGYVIGQDAAWPVPFARAVPAAALTFRWPLARGLEGGGISLIEPMAQVAWSDRWGQDPPDEDSRLVEFDEGNLLSLDRLPGSDRRETGLRAVVGLNWAHLGTGWSAGAAVGRVFRGEGDADFTAASGLAGARSDWLVAGQLVWDARLYLTGRALIGDDLSVAKAEAVLNYRQEGLRVGLGYAYVTAEPAEGRQDSIDELTLDSGWSWGRHWTADLGMRYDFDAERASKATLGVGYRNECVGVDLSLSRRFTSSTSVDPTTTVGLAVTLNGFGTDGRAWSRSCRG